MYNKTLRDFWNILNTEKNSLKERINFLESMMELIDKRDRENEKNENNLNYNR